MSVYLRRLEPSDIPDVIALEYKLLPREFCYNVAKTHERLIVPHIKGKNYSVAAFDGQHMVGYILMFDTASELYPNENVALIWELAISFRYRHKLSKLFMQWIIREAHMCDLRVEASLRMTTAMRMLQREYQLIQCSRYRVSHMHQRYCIGNERMVFMRFEPVFAPATLYSAAIERLGIHAERFHRIIRVLPLRILRRICYALPQSSVPYVLQEWSCLLPCGQDPEEVRRDID